MGFFPSKAEPNIWLHQNGDIYEYVAVYVDDLALEMKDSQAFIDIRKVEYHFKLKGTSSIAFHLGMGFFHDKDGMLCMAPRKYVKRIISTYKRLFSLLPKETYALPLEKGDHPEL